MDCISFLDSVEKSIDVTIDHKNRLRDLLNYFEETENKNFEFSDRIEILKKKIKENFK